MRIGRQLLIGLAWVLGAGLASQAALAAGKVEITWWHAMSGSRLKVVDKIVHDFNASHPDYELKALYTGTYPETMTKYVAIARKLLVTIWHVLTKREPDRYRDPEAIARSFMIWASQHHWAPSLGVHYLDFVRERQAFIGILDEVSSFQANGRSHVLKTDP